MERKTAGFLAAVLCGALLAGGCAKHEMVKQEEPIAPAATVAPAQAQQAQAAKAQQVTAAKAAEAQKEAATRANQAEELKAELKSGLEKVYFNFDSADLSEQARNTLVKDATLIKKIGKAVRVEGNCDERGSDDYNLALGEKRAKEAVQYLTNLGVPAERLSVISYGKEKPAAPGHDEASWAKNRRDELVIIP